MTKTQLAAIRRAHTGLLRVYRSVAPQLHTIAAVEGQPDSELAATATKSLGDALDALRAMIPEENRG